MILIDFETRSRTSIDAGAYRYATSCSTEVMCLSYLIDGTVKSWRPGEESPTDLLEAVASGEEVFAHNATFERAIWENIMVKNFDWPQVQPEQWHCTLAEGFAMGLPASLESVTKALKLPIQKDVAGHKLMLKMSKPRKATKKDKSPWHEKPEDIKRLRQYCDQDVLAELGVHNSIRRLIPREQQVFLFDARVNQRGVKVDVELAESVVAIWGMYTDRLNEELREITFGQIPSADAVKAITEFLPKIDANVTSLAKDALQETLQREIPPTARRVLEIRAELAMSSIAKFKKILKCVGSDGRIRGCFQYHGAQQTGRWAGRIVQLQNLPRGVLKPEQIDDLIPVIKRRNLDEVIASSSKPVGKVLSSLVRPTIIADGGKKLIVCDFASVEARGIAWAAGEKWLLKAFAQNKDAYIEMASTIYGVPYDAVTDSQRFYGKQCILGAGYQMGAGRFQELLKGYGVDAELDFCEKVIDAYRKKNSKIRSFWAQTEKAAVNAIQTGNSRRAGPYVFHMRGPWLHARMPCGRDISYFQPRLEPSKYGKKICFMAPDIRGKMSRESTYGGKLVENLTQAVCRDLLVDAMSRLERAGYSVIAHVHDEVILEVDEDFGSVEEVEQIMREVPRWAEGFPVDAKGFTCKRYRK